MAAFAGILNHSLTAGQALTGKSAEPMDGQATGTGGTSSAGTTGGASATISSNDFLTLLVTEMRNQDPTANTDPNEYINQLVQVNSLEQLISINQNLSTALGSSGSDSSGSTGSDQATPIATSAAAGKPAVAAGPAASPHGASGTAAAISQFAQSVETKQAPGNLSVPRADPAAHSVAHALDGHSHAKAVLGKLPGTR